MFQFCIDAKKIKVLVVLGRFLAAGISALRGFKQCTDCFGHGVQRQNAGMRGDCFYVSALSIFCDVRLFFNQSKAPVHINQVLLELCLTLTKNDVDVSLSPLLHLIRFTGA